MIVLYRYCLFIDVHKFSRRKTEQYSKAEYIAQPNVHQRTSCHIVSIFHPNNSIQQNKHIQNPVKSNERTLTKQRQMYQPGVPLNNNFSDPAY